jgi:perosamine synthetase
MEFFQTTVSKEAFSLSKKVLDSSFLSAGKAAIEFEKKLEKKIGAKNVVSLNSGTSSLHLGLHLMDLKPNDEVILPAQTFLASGLAILMTGAKPVFADINYETGNISTHSIKEKITSRTRAIMPIHYGGLPADLYEINKIAKQYNLNVIEDAAHALGSKYKGMPIGSISNFTAFSFQAIKQVTAGDGGALCCKKISNYNRAKKLRWFGIDREASKVSLLGERVFNVSELGFKYHMNDLAASIALGNLASYSSRLQRVKSIAKKYNKELSRVSGVKLLEVKSDRENSYWLFPMLVEKRDKFIKRMLEKKIPVSVVHQGIDRFDIFGGKVMDHIQQRKFDKNQICIPIHSGLTNNDINSIITAVKEGW